MGKTAKTKKAVMKRFKKTGTGKIIRYQAGKSHLATHKSSKRKRLLRKRAATQLTLARKLSILIP